MSPAQEELNNCPFWVTGADWIRTQCPRGPHRQWPGTGPVLAEVAGKLGMSEAAEGQPELWVCDMHGELLSAILDEAAGSLGVGAPGSS